MRSFSVLAAALCCLSCAPLEAPAVRPQYFHVPKTAKPGDLLCDGDECVPVREFRWFVHSVRAQP